MERSIKEFIWNLILRIILNNWNKIEIHISNKIIQIKITKVIDNKSLK